jgi:hypothetical protein
MPSVQRLKLELWVHEARIRRVRGVAVRKSADTFTRASQGLGTLDFEEKES